MATIIDLGKKVKAKYPGQYDDLPDDEVGRRVQNKYPGVYSDFSRVTPQLQADVAQTSKEANKSVARRFITELPKQAVKQTLGLAAKTAVSLADLPRTFATGDARPVNVPLFGKVNTIQSDAQKVAGEIIEGQKPLSAMAGPLSEAVLGPLDILGTGKLIKSGAQAGTKGVKAFAASRKAAGAVKDAKAVERLAGTIVQGKPEDIAKAKSALSQIDTKGIKTYTELGEALDDKVENIANKLDEVLSTAKQKIGYRQLTHQNHNYVDDALQQLDDLYTKTNNVAGKAKISQVRSVANTEGLTVKQVNDLARLHGREINAFNASGEAASGLSKQAAENTRKGLKSTAREFFNDPVYPAADAEMTNLIRTRDLIKDVAVKVNQLQQRVKERGWGEKIGRLAFQVVDKFSGGAVKGFAQSLIPRGQGLKIMNALDLEKDLQKNLKTLKELLSGNLPEATIEQKLMELLSAGATETSPRFARAGVAASTQSGKSYMRGKTAAINLGTRSDKAIEQAGRNAVAADTASGKAYMQGKAQALRLQQQLERAVAKAKAELQTARTITVKERIKAELARMEAKLKAVKTGTPGLSESKSVFVRDIN